MANIYVGDAFDPATSAAAAAGRIVNGPLISKMHFEKVLGYISKGKEEGARLLVGGGRHGNVGFFVQPTVFCDVRQDMAICAEEIFGPVLVVSKFVDLEDAIRKANDSAFGLAAAIWSKDPKKISTFVSQVKAGVVWTNTYNIVKYNAPFGGVKATGSLLVAHSPIAYLVVQGLVAIWERMLCLSTCRLSPLLPSCERGRSPLVGRLV